MPKVAVVTGANQGLGFGLVKVLAARLGSNDAMYLTARSEERGRAAVDAVEGARAKIDFAPLDVTDPDSVAALAAMLKARHGGVDVVASNAAARISGDRPQTEQVRAFVATNNHGSRAVFEALEPLLNRNARYVMVASSFGQLRRLPSALHPLFDVERLSLDEVEASMDRYVEAMEAGNAADEGWPDWINVPSKIGQVASARVAARDMARSRPNDGVLINAVCPGLVDTEASRPWFDDMSSARTPERAATPIVDLLLLPPGATEPQGRLVQFGKVLPWL